MLIPICNKTHFITKIMWLMMWREAVNINCENQIKNIYFESEIPSYLTSK